MKFIFAPDSFKGSLSARDVCTLLSLSAKAHFPKVQLELIPVADGGEGTVEALVLATNGQIQSISVTGPMNDPVTAQYGILGDGKTAVLEMAQASGLPLVTGEKNPMAATSLGTGEMLLHVLKQGYKTVYMGIGGSATNDGGMGMLQALGVEFFDENDNALPGCGESLAKVKRVDFSGLAPEAKQGKIVVMSDVTNPLLGESGATHIYGPQKGAQGAVLLALEKGMENYAKVIGAALNKDAIEMPGAGAAGGMGYALGCVLNAKIQPGIATVLDVVKFDKRVSDASLVITGEGRIDRQSVLFGKVAAGVAKRCEKANVPVIAIVGGMGEGAEGFFDIGQSSIMTTVNAPMDISYAMTQAKPLFASAADRMFRMIKMGMAMRERKIDLGEEPSDEYK